MFLLFFFVRPEHASEENRIVVSMLQKFSVSEKVFFFKGVEICGTFENKRHFFFRVNEIRL